MLETVSTKIDQEEGRSSRFTMKKRIVVGNLSKYVYLAISKKTLSYIKDPEIVFGNFKHCFY